MTTDPRLVAIATRLIWWKPAEAALADQRRFLAQAMTFGSWQDLEVVSSIFGLGALRAVLEDAPPGVFDGRSWTYWHARFGVDPAPALPSRRL